MPTEDELKAELDQIRSRKSEVLSNPSPSYTIDGVSYKWSEYLAELREQEQHILDQLRSMPVEESTQVDFGDEP